MALGRSRSSLRTAIEWHGAVSAQFPPHLLPFLAHVGATGVTKPSQTTVLGCRAEAD